MKNPAYRFVLLAALLLLAVTSVEAQTQRCECDSTGRRSMVTMMPEYKGGNDQLVRDLNALVDFAPSLNSRGQVRFVINCNGRMCSPQMLSRIDMNTDAQLLRALKELPDWSPGFLENTPIDSVVGLTIVIKDGRILIPTP